MDCGDRQQRDILELTASFMKHFLRLSTALEPL